MIWLLPPPSPLPSASVFFRIFLVRRHAVELTDGSGGGGGEGAESYDGEKAWSSINHLILSDSVLVVNKLFML